MSQNGKWTKIGIILATIYFILTISWDEPLSALVKGAILGVLIFMASMIIWKELIIPKLEKIIEKVMRGKEENVGQETE